MTPMKWVLRAFTATALLALLAGCGDSKSDAPPLSPKEIEAKTTITELFRLADGNHDGFLSNSEYEAAHTLAFREWDRDKSGALEPHEYATDPTVVYYLESDLDRDGNIAFEEHMKFYMALFANDLDLNGDGSITLDEIFTAFWLDR